MKGALRNQLSFDSLVAYTIKRIYFIIKYRRGCFFKAVHSLNQQKIKAKGFQGIHAFRVLPADDNGKCVP